MHFGKKKKKSAAKSVHYLVLKMMHLVPGKINHTQRNWYIWKVIPKHFIIILLENKWLIKIKSLRWHHFGNKGSDMSVKCNCATLQFMKCWISSDRKQLRAFVWNQTESTMWKLEIMRLRFVSISEICSYCCLALFKFGYCHVTQTLYFIWYESNEETPILQPSLIRLPIF